MKLIFSYIKRHIWLFLTAVLFLTVEAVMDLLQPTYMSFIVDEGVKNADVRLIMKYGASMLAIAGIGAFSAVMRSWFASITSRKIGK